MEETEVRKDINGNIISKSNKNHHISFKENFSEIIIVESYKEFNKLYFQLFTSILGIIVAQNINLI